MGKESRITKRIWFDSVYIEEYSNKKGMESYRLMSVKDYADSGGVSVQYIYQMIRSGKLESEKIGSVILVKIKT